MWRVGDLRGDRPRVVVLIERWTDVPFSLGLSQDCLVNVTKVDVVPKSMHAMRDSMDQMLGDL